MLWRRAFFGNAILAQGVAGGIILNSTLPIADFVHGAHHGQIRKAARCHIVQEGNMGGKILHVAGRIVAETIPPGHMDADIRLAQCRINIFVPTENRHIAEFCALVHALKGKVRCNDAVAHIQCFFLQHGGRYNRLRR